MSDEIKALAATQRGDLHSIHATANWLRDRLAGEAARCCRILGINPTTDSVARDIAEEIVLHGTPVDEVVAKLQRHLASPHSADLS